VAWRLNRLALQRALYRSLSAGLLALAVAAAWASRGAGSFRAALAVLALLALAAVAAAVWALRSRWAGPLVAARWVEERVPLDARLLTLVSARPDGGGSRLWPALVADNEAQLPRWRAERLGIRAVPPDVLLLLLALATALAALVPWGAPPPEVQRQASAAKAAPDPAGDGEILSPQPGGGAVVPGGAPGDDAQGGAARGVGALVSLDGLKAQLGDRFERSLAGALVADRAEAQRKADRAQAGADAAERGDPGPSGLGRSKAEAGGVPPDEDLARREQDDGTGQLVHRRGAQDGDAQGGRPAGALGQPGKSTQQAEVRAGAQGARPAAGGKGKPEGQMLAADGQSKQTNGSGGAGAGAGKGTGPLLAPKPLTLDGSGRPVAHFALALGATNGPVGEGKTGEVDAEPRSHIAEGARGAQAADHIVRREEIPADYESIVKRVFQREP
jgi:hypothetical protein